MKMPAKVAALAVVVALSATSALGSTGSSLNGQSNWAIELRGVVPVICRVSVDASIASVSGKTEVPLGVMTQFCNAPNGYEVYATHASGLSSATIMVAGVRVPLSDSGVTLIDTSASAAVTDKDLVLDLGESGQLTNLSLSIVPR